MTINWLLKEKPVKEKKVQKRLINQIVFVYFANLSGLSYLKQGKIQRFILKYTPFSRAR
jgi:hypothetical protein